MDGLFHRDCIENKCYIVTELDLHEWLKLVFICSLLGVLVLILRLKSIYNGKDDWANVKPYYAVRESYGQNTIRCRYIEAINKVLFAIKFKNSKVCK